MHEERRVPGIDVGIVISDHSAEPNGIFPGSLFKGDIVGFVYGGEGAQR